MLCKELDKVMIGSNVDRYFQVCAQIPPKEKEKLVGLLNDNVDFFTWSAYEAPGIDPDFICHHLNMNTRVVPNRQPLRRSSKEHAEAVKDKVIKLKQAAAIKETFYLEWLANTVVVKKKNEKWQLCVDFTDLNKACPKDPFLVPQID